MSFIFEFQKSDCSMNFYFKQICQEYMHKIVEEIKTNFNQLKCKVQ